MIDRDNSNHSLISTAIITSTRKQLIYVRVSCYNTASATFHGILNVDALVLHYQWSKMQLWQLIYVRVYRWMILYQELHEILAIYCKISDSEYTQTKLIYVT